MDWAKRWLKALLGRRKVTRERRDVADISGGDERREKKRWSFSRPRQTSAGGEQEQAGVLQRTCCVNSSDDTKRATIIAVATAAAADAAVCAAHAAMASLTSLSEGPTTMLLAVISIQKAFRGHLARKALRALKALVKLQALIRGQIVRKQAAETLQQLEALERAQALSFHRRSHGVLDDEERRIMRPEFFPRRSFEKTFIRENRIRYLASAQCQGSDRSPKIVKVDTYRPQSRSFHATGSDMHLPHQELRCKLPYHLTLRNFRCFQDNICRADAAKGGNSKTTQNTPRLPSASPARSPRTRGGIPIQVYSKNHCPSYMASTRSFAAKVRSQSTPKDRPETLTRLKNRITVCSMVESPASIVGNTV